jgi:hypothetical protein
MRRDRVMAPAIIMRVRLTIVLSLRGFQSTPIIVFDLDIAAAVQAGRAVTPSFRPRPEPFRTG